MPSPSKSQAKRIESPGSGSREPSLENCTLSGVTPLVTLAFIVACGARWPLTSSHRYRPASGFDWKKPSP